MGSVPFVGGSHADFFRPLSNYETKVRLLSDRLAQARRQLRVLDAVRWDAGVEQAFFAAGGREPPPVNRDYYAARPLGFEADSKREELRALERDVFRTLGRSDPAARLLLLRCCEYREVIDLLELRGTPAFGVVSRRLYGGADDRPLSGGPTLVQLGRAIASQSRAPAAYPGIGVPAETLGAAEVATALAWRLGSYFGAPGAVRVRVAHGLTADATAGAGSLRVRAGARFTPLDIRLLEVHEGWVHLGTTLNGRRQRVCTFLEQGSPSATATQEGLAVLTELLTLASSPVRLRRLAHRVAGIALAQSGASFLEVYRFFQSEGYSPRESYQHTARIFRGSLPAGCGPFTKDLCYLRGFAQVHEHALLALRNRDARRLTFLFCGKTALDDLPALTELVEAGIVARPAFVPPPFVDLLRLSARVRAATPLIHPASHTTPDHSGP